ncbi:MAG: hypothetical protein HC938_02100 [Nitrospira sp.]|nr:hypothetical protein [Nitrospira sp.]
MKLIGFLIPHRTSLLPLFLTGILAWLGFGTVGCGERQEEPVVALVNGRAITQTEFDLRWSELSQATRSRYEKEGGKRRFLDELITKELLMQEARRRGLDQDDAIRDKTQRYKEQLILDELLKDKLQSKVELTQEELTAYYESHASELLDPLKANISIMLLPNIYAAKDLEAQINRGGSLRSSLNGTRSMRRRGERAATWDHTERGSSSLKWMRPSIHSNQGWSAHPLRPKPAIIWSC